MSRTLTINYARFVSAPYPVNIANVSGTEVLEVEYVCGYYTVSGGVATYTDIAGAAVGTGSVTTAGFGTVPQGLVDLATVIRLAESLFADGDLVLDQNYQQVAPVIRTAPASILVS